MASRKKQTTTQLGKQPPRYRFSLNPYEDMRFTRCPQCDNKMHQRKLPLMIHIDPMYLLSLNKTCRYCPHCDLLIAHQDELEEVISRVFSVLNPEVVGNNYLVIGSLDRADWKRIDQNKLPVQDTIEALHDFKDVVTFKPMGGWRR